MQVCTLEATSWQPLSLLTHGYSKKYLDGRSSLIPVELSKRSPSPGSAPMPDVALQPRKPVATAGVIWADLRGGVCSSIYTPDMIDAEDDDDDNVLGSAALDNGSVWPLGVGLERLGLDEAMASKTPMHRVLVARNGEVRTCLRPVTPQRVLTPSRLGYQRKFSKLDGEVKVVKSTKSQPRRGLLGRPSVSADGRRSFLEKQRSLESSLGPEALDGLEPPVTLTSLASTDMCCSIPRQRADTTRRGPAARLRSDLNMIIPAGRTTPRLLESRASRAESSLSRPQSVAFSIEPSSNRYGDGSSPEVQQLAEKRSQRPPALLNIYAAPVKDRSVLGKVNARLDAFADMLSPFENFSEDAAAEPDGHLSPQMSATFEATGGRSPMSPPGGSRGKPAKTRAVTEELPDGRTGRSPGKTSGKLGQNAEALKLAKAIEEIVLCGKKSQPKLPPEKQSNIQSDGLAIGTPRDLSNSERERLMSTFMAYRRVVEQPEETRAVAHNTSIAWQDVAAKLRGCGVSAQYIQRLRIYFQFPKTFKISWYTTKIGRILSLNKEQRVRMCFGILDVDGDGNIGLRDIFALLAASRTDRTVTAGIDDNFVNVNAYFMDSASLGLVIGRDGDPVIKHVAPSSMADMQGVKIGDRITHVGGVNVSSLCSGELRRLLDSDQRPFQMQLRRLQAKQDGKQFVFAAANCKRLMDATQAMTALKLKVTIISAKDLRNADGGRGISDPYCTLEVVGKPHTKAQTRVISDTLSPAWNEVREVVDFTPGDTLKFEIRDQDIGSKEPDELLGRVSLSMEQFIPSGFDGELTLQSAGRGQHATIRLRIECQNVAGGLGLSQFSELFGGKELSFLGKLAEMLTGSPLPSLDAKVLQKNPPLKIVVVSASGLRSADPGGLSDPYCIVDLPAKPTANKVTTRVIDDTLDPVWNHRCELDDYTIGHAVRFSVYDKDVGTKPDDLLGQIQLSGAVIAAGGFEGDLLMNEGGRGYQPRIKLKIVCPVQRSIEPSAPSPIGCVRGSRIANASEAATNQHQYELQRIYQWVPKENVAPLVTAYEAICDEDLRLRVSSICMVSVDLFGVGCGLLAAQLHKLMDTEGEGDIGVEAWVKRLYRCHTDGGCAMAFALYDFDGDGEVGVNDALCIADEDDRLERIRSQMTMDSGKNSPVCGELRWLYGLVADNTDSYTGDKVKLDYFAFRQIRPTPVVTAELCKGLEGLAQPVLPVTPTASSIGRVSPMGSGRPGITARGSSPVPATRAASTGQPQLAKLPEGLTDSQGTNTGTNDGCLLPN